MKTKIAIDVLSDEGAGFLLTLVDLIGKNNCGKMELIPSDISMLVKMEKIKYTSLHRNLSIINQSDNYLEITASEDLKPVCSISWKEVHELNTISEQEVVNC